MPYAVACGLVNVVGVLKAGQLPTPLHRAFHRCHDVLLHHLAFGVAVANPAGRRVRHALFTPLASGYHQPMARLQYSEKCY